MLWKNFFSQRQSMKNILIYMMFIDVFYFYYKDMYVYIHRSDKKYRIHKQTFKEETGGEGEGRKIYDMDDLLILLF